MVKKGGGDDQDQPRSDIIKPSSSSSSTAQQATGGNILHTTPSQQLQQQPQLQSQPSHTAATSIPTRRPQEQSSEPDRLSQTELPASTPLRHQVIAVSASKGPAAFFNLARKFLVTDEFCDLSALEGAIVSAVDAAHLLERSKLADIVRIQTSYVPVEPKRRPQQDSSKQSDIPSEAVGAATAATITPPDLRREEQPSSSRKIQQGRKGAPLRRSRIIITVKRTVDYKQWLEENPHQAAGHGDDIEDSPS